MTATLQLGPELELPIDAVTRATGVFGQRGTGKTSTAVVLVEEAAAGGAQFVVLDPTGAWYGLRASADGQGAGLEVVIFGGYNGDVPLEPTAGRFIAKTAVETGANVVLDLEQMTKGEQVRFAAEFGEELYHLNRRALTLVVDEAPRFAPAQIRDPGGYGARCLGAITDIVTLGRRKGLGAVLIAQRMAALNANVREQAEIIVAHRLMGTNDRKALAGWLEDQVDDAADHLAALPKLERGSAIVLAPAYGVGDVYAIRPKRTFDSSATPEVGAEIVTPVGRADIDLSAIREAMAETIEREQANDPEALKARIRDLERQIAEGTDTDALQNEVNQSAEIISELRTELAVSAGDLAASEAQLEQTRDRLIEIGGELHRVVLGLPTGVGDVDDADVVTTHLHIDGKEIASAAAAPPASPPRPNRTAQAGDGPPLKAGAKRMLRVLVSYDAISGRGLTRQELSTLAVVARGGTLSDYLSALRTLGLVVDVDGKIEHTYEGAAVALEDGYQPRRFTPDEVVALHAPKLKAGARRMLDVLMRAPEQGFTRKELGGLAGVAAGGTLSDYLSSLRSRGLIDERAKRIFPAAVLYLGESR